MLLNLRQLNPTMGKLLESFKLDIEFIKGEGLYLFDANERMYLDFIAQYGAVPFGYNPPDIIEAAREFLDSGLPSMVQPSIPVKAAELAEFLLQRSPGKMEQVTFCQSGAEAVETAIKMARVATGKKIILSTTNSFHGKTMGALSATGRTVYQEPFFMPAPGFEYVAYNDIEKLEAILKEKANEIAAFIVEPIQGEGGIIIPYAGYLREAERLCRKYKVLFIIDEIQTGLGRTGHLFASEQDEAEPDMLLIAKALGGGLVPVGACLSNKAAWTEEFGRLHSSTFANNNFTCAIGLAVLRKLMENQGSIIKHVGVTGKLLLDGLEGIRNKYPDVIKEVRGRGLMAGIEFNGFDGSESFSLRYLALQGGFSALLSGYLLHRLGIRCAPFLNNPMTLRLQPSLTVTEEQVNQAVAAVEKVAEILYLHDHCELYSYLFDWENFGVPRNYRRFKKPLVSSYCDLRNDESAVREKYAFLIHYPSAEDVIRNNPSFERLNSDQLEEFLDWEASIDSAPAALIHMPAIRSKAGKVAEGWLIGVPYSGRHLTEMPRKEAVEVLLEAVNLAKKLGAKIVGLGAYTSVVSRGGSDLQNKGVAITSGNSYTVATAFDALVEGARLMDIKPADAVGAVIGATGAIGRVCTLMLAEEVRKLYLVGNPNKERTSVRRLERLAEEIYQRAFKDVLGNLGEGTTLKGVSKWLKSFLNHVSKRERGIIDSIKNELENNNEFSFGEFIARYASESGKFSSGPLVVTVNIKDALRNSDLIISASNATSELIGPEYLKPGSVICDVARPADVSKTVLERRKDVLVIEGGLVRYPEKVCFGQNMGYDPGINLACLSETLLLALEGDYRDYSIGLKLSLEEINYLRGLAEKHGFELAMPTNERGIVTAKTALDAKRAVYVDGVVSE